MNKVLVVIKLLIFLISFSFSQTNGQLFDQAESAFIKLDYIKSINIFKEILKSNPTNYEANWKIARVYVNLGEVPGNEKNGYFSEAKNYAEKSININSDKSDGYTYLAAAVGNLAFWGSNSQKIEYSWQMFNLLKKALFINPKDDVALSILGSLEHQLANVSWIERSIAKVLYSNSLPDGKYENAVHYFQEAITINPNLIRHHYELGLVYKTIKDYQKAKDQFNIALNLPIQLKADFRRIELIKEYLKELE